PVTFQARVQFNLPVVASAVRESLYLDGGSAGKVGVNVKPFRRPRYYHGAYQGMRWLPVPGQPGTVIHVTDTRPQTKQNRRSARPTGHSTWIISPDHPLEPPTTYTLRARPGLETTVGNLRGKGNSPDESQVTTFGPFKFTKVQ